MSRNGSGQYDLPTNSWNPATNGNAATTVDWQDLIDDVAAALTQSVSADGQTPMTGSLNMNGNKVENLANAVANDDAATLAQVYSQGIEQSLASAGTTDIGAVNSNFVLITGTTTITSLGANYNGPRFVRFNGILTLTHNASTLLLPGGANITTAANDRAIFVPKGNPSDGWNCVVYQYASGQKITGNLTVTGTIEAGGYLVYNRNNIIGTVSESAGIPTGSIIERGSNANGEYVRYADGTQECWFTSASASATGTATGSIFASSVGFTFTFPAAFISKPNVTPIAEWASGASIWAAQNNMAPTTTQCRVQLFSFASTPTAYPGYRAIGRWY